VTDATVAGGWKGKKKLGDGGVWYSYEGEERGQQGAYDGAGGRVANVLGGGVAKAAGSDGVAHAEAGDKPSVEDVPEVEVTVLGGEESG
jgi:hypothetical protein